jgi:ABC-type polysaccharide/polyol phosphate transport system ATPase subunit
MSPSAIDVMNVTKTFLLPHEQRTMFKEYFLHPFRRMEYERQLALDNVSFSVGRGEFFGIVGPNGSGKSTLLRILAGIYRPDSGRVRIGGVVSPFIELGVGFHPELSARDNVRLNAMLLGMTRAEVEANYDTIIEFAELERFVDQKLKNYSSGMMLRLAYAIAIQVPFDILLLDEVLAVGDQAFQQKCFATFDRFRDERKTVVFVSHDLASVRRHCTSALLLRHGIAEAVGPADEVVERYANRVAVS